MSEQTRGEWRIQMAGKGLAMLFAKIVLWAGTGLTGFLGYPWFMNWYLGRWAGNLLIDGRRVRYTGSPTGIIRLWIKIWLLSVVTFSLYYWLRGRSAMGRYWDSHLEWA